MLYLLLTLKRSTGFVCSKYLCAGQPQLAGGVWNFIWFLVRVGLLCLNFDLAEPNNLTQNTARKILFLFLWCGMQQGSVLWGGLAVSWGALQEFCYTFIFNPLLNKLNCKGLILFSGKSKGSLQLIKMGTTWGSTLVIKPKIKRALCGWMFLPAFLMTVCVTHAPLII